MSYGNRELSYQKTQTKQPLKLNSDGASCGNPGKAGGGVILRDCNGMWIRGYARSIGYASSIITEFWALRDGLKLALNEGIQ